MIKTRPLFEIALNVPQITDLGQTPLGGRKIATVTGGTFEGERVRGTVLPTPGGDWLLTRADGVVTLDVRLTLQTHDSALIYMHYKGMRHGPEDVIAALNRGEDVDPTTYYFRSTPLFETASKEYAWMNKIVCVATGRRVATGPIYNVFEVL